MEKRGKAIRVLVVALGLCATTAFLFSLKLLLDKAPGPQAPQVAPWAPWEIRRADLEAEPIRSILERLRRTGELVLPGMGSAAQPSLFQ